MSKGIKKSDEQIQEELDALYGKGVCLFIERVNKTIKGRARYYFTIKWLECGTVQTVRDFPKWGSPNNRAKQQSDLHKGNSYSLGKQFGLKDEEKYKKEVIRALGDKVVNFTIYLNRKPNRSNKRVTITWHTGEISDHSYGAIVSGLTQHPPSQTQAMKEKTCIERYGVKNPTMNSEIRLKAAKATNKTYEIVHWKTNEALVCQGLYEYTVALYFNELKVDYLFQIPNMLPDGRSYTIDFKRLDTNTFIEVKGRWYDEDAKNKYETFIVLNPNTELWNVEKLKKLGIYKKYLKIWKEQRENADYKASISSKC